jgi:hypothetical protein
MGSLFHYLMHFVWGSIVTALLAAFAWVARSRSLLLGSIIGLAFCLVVIATVWTHRFREVRRRESPEIRRIRRELSYFTDAGLSWEMVDRVFVNEHTEVTLRIRPTGAGDELPQPLGLLVTCAGIQDVLTVKHHPSETDDFDIYPPDNTRLILKLRSPRLYPPAHLDVRLRSKGTDLTVMSVKRNPKPLRAL